MQEGGSGGWGRAARRAARVYCAKRDRTRERSDNDIFQNNSLFQGSSFAYEARQRGRVEKQRKGKRGRERERKLWLHAVSLVVPWPPWRLVAAGRLIEYTRGQCSLHNTGVSRKWRHSERDREREREREIVYARSSQAPRIGGVKAARRNPSSVSQPAIYCVTHNWPCCRLAHVAD